VKPPILILQMQRMGDTILTFPLVLWLSRRHPGHPIWIVAEQVFFKALLPVSPAVTYFPWQGTARLLKERFLLCVNLSHRPEAAELAGRVRAEETLGPIALPGGSRYIRGFFQLYRAALTHCNRHNHFHWADLNALDAVSLEEMRATGWPAPRSLSAQARGLGLFVGASEPAKRPDPGFWAVLAGELDRRGFRPVLFGGPGERELAAQVVRQANCRVIDQVGRLNLAELAAVGQAMQLLITPDTGPMHLAAWTGTKVLNLSMGPVNPWETGPYQPGHYVLRAASSCVGCWECGRQARVGSHPCKESFSPARVALLAARLAAGQSFAPGRVRLPGQRLMVSARDDAGLYLLKPLLGPAPQAREGLSRFWADFFGWRAGLWPEERPATSARALAELQPALTKALLHALPRFSRGLRQSLSARPGTSGTLPQGFWKSVPPMARPLSSWLDLFLQNRDGAPQAKREVLAVLEALNALFARP